MVELDVLLLTDLISSAVNLFIRCMTTLFAEELESIKETLKLQFTQY
jgi:hypothetical protein